MTRRVVRIGGDSVQTSEIFRVGLPWLDVEIDEDRALFTQETARRAVPLIQVVI
jgi:hypothetical protein